MLSSSSSHKRTKWDSEKFKYLFQVTQETKEELELKEICFDAKSRTSDQEYKTWWNVSTKSDKKNNSYSSKKKRVCVFPEKGKTCLTTWQKDCKTASSQKRSTVMTSPEWKGSKGTRSQENESIFFPRIPKNPREFCRLPQAYFEDLEERKFHNLHNYLGLPISTITSSPTFSLLILWSHIYHSSWHYPKT